PLKFGVWPPNPSNGTAVTQNLFGSDDKTSGPQGTAAKPGTTGNQGYYVLGPEVTFPGGAVTPTLMRPEMSYDIPVSQKSFPNYQGPTPGPRSEADVNASRIDGKPDPAKNCQPTIILQRLLCPYLPPNYKEMDTEFPPNNREPVDLKQPPGTE